MAYYNKPTESEVVKTDNIIFGNTAIRKGRMMMPQQGPVQPEEVEKHQTLMPHSHGRKNGIDVVEQQQPDVHNKPTIGKSQLDVGMHSHFGSPNPHPIRMRHRKASADPLHKEEDSLMDEWYDLYDKAQQGQCTAQELKRIEEIRGRIGEINSSRSSDAERILGIAMKALTSSQGHVAKAEGAFQVTDSDLKDVSVTWQGKEAEYGDPVDDLEIIPRNDGYKDQADHSESIGQSMPKDDRVFSAEPDVVKDAPVKKSFLAKAAQVTDAVVSYFEKNWGHDVFNADDGRFSDPLFYEKYISKAAIAKHDLPGSPHWQHMTNGGGWGVKLNPKTGNFVAYQTEDGAMKKREAQAEAIKRNNKNKGEREANDKVENGLDLDSINERIMQAIKPLDSKPLYKEPRMRP